MASPGGLARIAAADTSLKWDYPPHLRALNLALLDMHREDSRFLMCFMPPGHGKSSFISEAFPAWYLCTHPDEQIILTTYGQTFSEQWGRKARDLVMHYGPPLYGVGVRQDSKSVSEWRIAEHRGGMLSVGSGGRVTGNRADGAIIDDPIKNQEEAESLVYRDNLEEWFEKTLYTRLKPDGWIVLCMTRWNHDDLAGRLLEKMAVPWRVLSFPALAEEGDPLGRMPGEPLWPKMFGRERLAEAQAMVSEYAWLAMYQQRPTPEHGAVYQRAWFEQRYDLAELPKLDYRILAVDSAFKLGVGSDYTAIEVWGVTPNGYYLVHVVNERLEYPELIATLKEMAREYDCAGVYIEDKASGQSAVQTLQRETRLPVVAVPVNASKQQRADGNAPTWRAGKVWLPRSAGWVGGFVAQHVQFPRAAHDDMVDAGNIALDVLKYGGVSYGKITY